MSQAESESHTLDELRSRLDALDDELLALLNRRASVVENVGAQKKQSGTPFYVPNRERRIIERLVENNTGPFPSGAIRPVIQEIISACLSLEKRQRIAYLGPEGTFTHQAVTQQFGTSAALVPCGTIAGVFAEIERQAASYGVVPIENATEGVVSHTLDRFVDSDVQIIAELLVPVAHCLLTRHGMVEGQIKRVYSHPQALAQCQNWIQTNLPKAELVPSRSTADAAQACHDDQAGGAIASETASRMHDLSVLRAHIQDAPKNVTRFLVLGPPGARTAPSGNDKTSVLMVLRDDPGALYEALKPLSAANINLSKIESRPSRRQAWEYVFFLDLLGHCEQQPISGVVTELGQICQRIQILGSYRCAATETES